MRVSLQLQTNGTRTDLDNLRKVIALLDSFKEEDYGTDGK